MGIRGLGAGTLILGMVAFHACTAEAVGPSGALRDYVGPYQVQVLVGGVVARTFYHDGESFVLGQMGERYTLRVHNRTGRRVEAVITIDGRDIIDGQPGNYRNKRGYLIPAWGSVDIDGWRVSQAQAAAFRFSSVANSYAAQTGSAREVGVIGVAIFPERYVPPPPPRRPLYVPHSRPEYRSGAMRRPRGGSGDALGGYGGGGRAAAPSASAESSAGHAEQEPADRSASYRPGLGTEYGEAVESRIRHVAFVRANATAPSAILGMRYNDRDGLLAMGIDVDGYGVDDNYLRRTATPFPEAERSYAPPPPGWRGW